MSTHDIGQLHPEPSEGEPFIGEHQLDDSDEGWGAGPKEWAEAAENARLRKQAERERLHGCRAHWRINCSICGGAKR